MHPRLEKLSRLVEANKNQEISTTQLWLNQCEVLSSSPALIAALVEIRERAADWDVSEDVIDEIIEKHLGAGE